MLPINVKSKNLNFASLIKILLYDKIRSILVICKARHAVSKYKYFTGKNRTLRFYRILHALYLSNYSHTV